MNSTESKNLRKKRRSLSVRRRLRRGERPVRLSIFRSSKHTYAQVVDDESGKTICAVGTSAKSVAGELSGKSKTERAQFVGREIARIAKDKGVERVVFDRGSYKYHGRVKALADAAREGGLQF